MQVQGCGATPVDRDMKRSLLWLTHREVESKGSNLTCFHRDAALVLDAGRHDDRSPPLTLPEALRQRPSSPPEHGQTAGVGGLTRQRQTPPPQPIQPIRPRVYIGRGSPLTLKWMTFKRKVDDASTDWFRVKNPEVPFYNNLNLFITQIGHKHVGCLSKQNLFQRDTK